MKSIDPIAFEKECTFRTARSGGKGGQHVNKVETKVVLVFSVAASELFDENEKAALHQKLAARLTQKGVLQVSCDRERSQIKNKTHAITKAITILEKALTPVKPRKKTKPTKASVEKRLLDKSCLAKKKELRIKI
ncbi:MAG: aminoacyl-tRNA hydrolase [Prevotellaceae bacterium]|nr:aminoacyl-tRNA hydrolase [Prevotellaceae bacterium]